MFRVCQAVVFVSLSLSPSQGRGQSWRSQCSSTFVFINRLELLNPQNVRLSYSQQTTYTLLAAIFAPLIYLSSHTVACYETIYLCISATSLYLAYFTKTIISGGCWGLILHNLYQLWHINYPALFVLQTWMIGCLKLWMLCQEVYYYILEQIYNFGNFNCLHLRSRIFAHQAIKRVKHSRNHHNTNISSKYNN